jgi:hypothetical protein
VSRRRVPDVIQSLPFDKRIVTASRLAHCIDFAEPDELRSCSRFRDRFVLRGDLIKSRSPAKPAKDLDDMSEAHAIGLFIAVSVSCGGLNV